MMNFQSKGRHCCCSHRCSHSWSLAEKSDLKQQKNTVRSTIKPSSQQSSGHKSSDYNPGINQNISINNSQFKADAIKQQLPFMDNEAMTAEGKINNQSESSREVPESFNQDYEWRRYRGHRVHWDDIMVDRKIINMYIQQDHLVTSTLKNLRQHVDMMKSKYCENR
ncbi:hypothetical protein MP228_006552 [Amoeboaphelidium protococcarum]|nr:hypothetical protein MP228_006552 [Amoeboaphelidium protococcarum]